MTTNQIVAFHGLNLQLRAAPPLATDELSFLAVSDSGETLAVLTRSRLASTDSRLSVFRTTDLHELNQLVISAADRALNLACSADGRYLAVAQGARGNRVRSYEVPSLRETGHTEYLNVELVLQHTLRVQGQDCFLICDNNDLIALRQADLRELCRAFGHKHGIFDAVASPDRQTVYTLGGDGLKAWHAATLARKEVFAGDHAQARLLAISPDGLTLVSAANMQRGIRLWDVRTSQQILEFSPPDQRAQCHGIRFTPDGKRLIVTHHKDFPAMMLDTRTGLSALPSVDGEAQRP